MQETSFLPDVLLDIKVLSGSRHPDAPEWPEAWMKVKITSLSSNITQDIGYSLGVSRVRIALFGCLCSVLKRSPENSRSDVKIKRERSHSTGIYATLGLTPGVQLEGAVSRTSGEEINQSEWKVAVCSLPLDTKNGSTCPTQTTVIRNFMPIDNHSRSGGNPPSDIKPPSHLTWGRWDRTCAGILRV